MGALTYNPLIYPDAYNTLTIAGVATPGVVEITGADRAYNWDTKQTAGAQGSTSTYRGWKVSEGIKAKFRFWTPDQIAAFEQTVRPVITIDATKTAPKPLDVSHPILTVNDIFSVFVTSIGQYIHEGGQLYSLTVDLSEYRLPKKTNVTTTPTNSKPNAPGAGTKPPPMQSEIDRQIADAYTEFGKP